MVIKDLNSSDHQLLELFYKDLLLPAFGMFRDELEPLSVFQTALQNQTASEYKLHVSVVLNNDQIIAGCSYELYPKSCCGLITYISVKKEFQGKGYGRLLVNHVLSIMSGYGVKALFLETNKDNVSAEVDVMTPVVRRNVLRRLGFQVVDVDYVQPALSSDRSKCRDLFLGVHENFLENGMLSSSCLVEWLTEFYEVLMGDGARTDPDLLAIRSALELKEYVITKAT